jgi:hypothetical protein
VRTMPFWSNRPGPEKRRSALALYTVNNSAAALDLEPLLCETITSFLARGWHLICARPDGNCLFTSASVWLAGDESAAVPLRSAVAARLQADSGKFEDFGLNSSTDDPEALSLRDMINGCATVGTQGGELCVLGISDFLEVRIVVYTHDTTLGNISRAVYGPGFHQTMRLVQTKTKDAEGHESAHYSLVVQCDELANTREGDGVEQWDRAAARIQRGWHGRPVAYRKPSNSGRGSHLF